MNSKRLAIESTILCYDNGMEINTKSSTCKFSTIGDCSNPALVMDDVLLRSQEANQSSLGCLPWVREELQVSRRLAFGSANR